MHTAEAHNSGHLVLHTNYNTFWFQERGNSVDIWMLWLEKVDCPCYVNSEIFPHKEFLELYTKSRYFILMGDFKMYQHHKDSIVKLGEYFEEDHNVIAVILGGSIAKGCERMDSDIDAIVVVTDERYNNLSQACKLSESVFGHCTYESGYFDIKYVNKDYLRAVGKNGSEPARASFEKAWCIFSRDKEIEVLIREIPVFQKQEKKEKLLAFYSAFCLNSNYFWDISKDNPYLKARAITDIVLFGLRIILQEKEILFPCNKGLLSAVSKLGPEASCIIEKGNKLISTGNEAAKDEFVFAVMEFVAYTPPQDFSEVLTSYINNHELWWYKHSPVIAEW